MTTVTLQYFDGCPHWQAAERNLRAVADQFDVELQYQEVDTPEAAEEHQFRGSPTILVDGVDVFASGDEPVGLSCRRYRTPDGPAGSPTLDQLRAVLQ